MFDAVMATAGAPRRGSSNRARALRHAFLCHVCQLSRGVCMASDAINSLDAIPTLSNIEHALYRLWGLCDSKLNPGCLAIVGCAHCWCVGVWHRV
jgi:hypothetical protein